MAVAPSALESLPHELLYDVLLRLDVGSLMALSATSRHMYDAVRDHDLWRALLRQDGEAGPVARYVVKRCIHRAGDALQSGDSLAKACLSFLALARCGLTHEELFSLLKRWAADPGHRVAIDTSGPALACVIDAMLAVVGPFLIEERTMYEEDAVEEERAFISLPSNLRTAVLSRAGIPSPDAASASPEGLRAYSVLSAVLQSRSIHRRSAESLLFALAKLERPDDVAAGLGHWELFAAVWLRGRRWPDAAGGFTDPTLDNIEGLESHLGGPHPLPGGAAALRARRDVLSHLRACEKAKPGATRAILGRLRDQAAAVQAGEEEGGRAARLARAVRLFRLAQLAMCTFLGARRTTHFLAHREPVTDNEAALLARELFDDALELLEAEGAWTAGAAREEALLAAEVATQASYCYWSLGQHEAGVPLARRAVAARAALLGPGSAQTGDSLCKLGILLHDSMRFGDAERCLVQALAVFQGLATPPPGPAPIVNGAKASVASGPPTPPAQLRQRPSSPVQQQSGAAERGPSRTASTGERDGPWAALSPADPVRAIIKHCRDAALPAGHESSDFANLAPLLPRPHPLVPRCLNDLGRLWGEMGKGDASREAHAEALAIREATLGVGAVDCSQSLLNLGVRELDGGEYWTSFKMIQRAVHIRMRCLGADHVLTRNAADCLSRRFRRFLLTLLQQQNLNVVAGGQPGGPAPAEEGAASAAPVEGGVGEEDEFHELEEAPAPGPDPAPSAPQSQP